MTLLVISLALQSLWVVILYRWTKSVGKEMDVIRDQIANLSTDQVSVDKQLHDIWIALGDLEQIVSDRDVRAKTSTPKKRKPR